MSSTTTPAGVPMDSLYCNDNSHSIIPSQAQDFVRAKCPLPKMSKEEKGSDGQYHGRIVHRAAVKQHKVNEYHTAAKEKWQKLEQAKVQRQRDEQAKVEASAHESKAKQLARAADKEDSGDEGFEVIDRDHLDGAPDDASAGGKQTGGSKKRSLAGRIWSGITGK